MVSGELTISDDSAKQVLQFYDSIHAFTVGIASLLKLPQQCVSTAMIIFHKFAVQNGGFKSISETEMCGLSALFLATKLCNFLVSVSKLASVYCTKQNLSEEGVAEKIIELELSILCSIGFDLNIDLPYSYVEKMKPFFEDAQKMEKYLRIVYNFLNDSFKLPLCLYYSPVTISMATFYLLKMHFKVALVDSIDGKKWHNYLSDQTSIDEIVEVANLMNSMYERLKKYRASNAGLNSKSREIQLQSISVDLNLLSKKREETPLKDDEKKDEEQFLLLLPTLSSQ